MGFSESPPHFFLPVKAAGGRGREIGGKDVVLKGGDEWKEDDRVRKERKRGMK